MPKGVYKRTEETKRKMSLAKKGKLNYWKGKKRPPFTEEHKKRISKAKLGKGLYLWTKEYRKNYWKNYRQNYRRPEKYHEQKIEIDRKYAKTIRKEIRKKRRQSDSRYRLDCNISCLISICLKGKKTGRHWETLIGYSVEDLIKHLENKFDSKMTWDNYGNYWSVDHIKPRSLFKYETAEDLEFKECWALENLQPLEKITNIKKSNHF